MIEWRLVKTFFQRKANVTCQHHNCFSLCGQLAQSLEFKPVSPVQGFDLPGIGKAIGSLGKEGTPFWMLLKASGVLSRWKKQLILNGLIKQRIDTKFDKIVLKAIF